MVDRSGQGRKSGTHLIRVDTANAAAARAISAILAIACICAVGFAIGALVNVPGFQEQAPEHFRILLATHSDVGEMVQEEAKNPFAVLGILPSIEDMLMPKGIDIPRWDDRTVEVCGGEEQEAFIQHFHAFDLLARPALAFGRVHEFELDAAEVEFVEELPHDGRRLLRGLINDGFWGCGFQRAFSGSCCCACCQAKIVFDIRLSYCEMLSIKSDIILTQA